MCPAVIDACGKVAASATTSGWSRGGVGSALGSGGPGRESMRFRDERSREPKAGCARLRLHV